MSLVSGTNYSIEVKENKNVIINGNFDIWQRGTGFTAIAELAYSADRILYRKGGTMVHNVARSTDVPTYAESGTKSNYSLLAQVSTADATIDAANYCFLEYKVEGYDYARIAGGDATLSFWVKGAKTGIHCVSFRNVGNDRTYVKEYTIATADTWQKVELTVPLTETGGTWDYINGVGLRIDFVLAMGSNFHGTKDAWAVANNISTSSQVNEVDTVANNFRIAQVQFERGAIATDFEYKSFVDELVKCQRYYEKSYEMTSFPGSSGGTGASQGRVWVAGAYRPVMAAIFKVRKAGLPSVTVYPTHTTNNPGYFSNHTNSVLLLANTLQVSEQNYWWRTASSVAVGVECKGHWVADAEL